MRNIAQVKARAAARAKARDAAVVGSLGALAVGMCVFCAAMIGDRPQVRPVADTAPRTVPASTVLPPSPPSLPAVPARPVGQPISVPALGLLPDQPDDVGPAGGSGPSATVSGLAADGIPATALAAYRHAAAILAADRPGCHLDWSLLAAIARVESDHGRFGDSVLTTSGVSIPPIRGPRLDGGAFAVVRDSDGGRLDGDPVYDRAIGPFQFLPSTWRAVASDGNGDGVDDPYDIFDAAVGAGVYLCSGSTDLADPADLHAAVFRYNHSDSYVSLVLSLAAGYRTGVAVVTTTHTTTTPHPATTVAPPTVRTTTVPTTTVPTTTVPTTTVVPTTPVAPTTIPEPPTDLPILPIIGLLVGEPGK